MISMSSSIWVIAFTVFSLSGSHAYSSCTKQSSPCGCKTDTGDVIDLQQFGKTYSTSDSDYTYNFQTCTEVSCSSGTSSTASVCQSSKSGLIFTYDLGSLSTQAFQTTPSGEVQVLYTASDGQRKSIITISCDSTVTGDPQLTIIKVNQGTPTVYDFQFKSSKFCFGGDASGGGESQAGTIIVSLFFALLALYFIIGILINLFYRKRSGIEVIPNHDFWLSLPGLIKDGFMFVFGRFCHKTGYQEKI